MTQSQEQTDRNEREQHLQKAGTLPSDTARVDDAGVKHGQQEQAVDNVPGRKHNEPAPGPLFGAFHHSSSH